MNYRILGSLIVLASILILPYWIYFSILFIAMVIFPFYWESILFAFLIDALYGSGVESLPSVVSPTALITLVVVIILIPLRERLRTYV